MQYLIYIFAFIGIVMSIVIIYDMLIIVYQWQSRIHIGRWEDEDEWISAISLRSEKWLINPPKIKVKDNTRLLLFDIVNGNYSHSVVQSWQEAGLILGLEKLPTEIDLLNGDQIDIALRAYALMKISELTEKNEKDIHKIYDFILEKRGIQQTVPYRSFLPDIRFVDTIGLICPFLMLYGIKFNNPESIKLSLQQIEEYDKALLPGSFFPPHAFNKKNNKAMGIYDWGRGLGWYVLGLTECYDLLKDNNISEAEMLSDKIVRLGKSLINYCNDGGTLSDMFFMSNNQPESSATLFGGILFYNVYKQTGEKEWLEAAKRCKYGLMKSTQRNGAIDNCQGDTPGIGRYSTSRGYMPFVQGLTLRFANQLRNEK